MILLYMKVVVQIRTCSVIYKKIKLRNCRRSWLLTKMNWLKGMKRFISCVKKTIHLKPVNFHISILKSQMTKWYFLRDLIVPDLYGCSTKQKVAPKSYILQIEKLQELIAYQDELIERNEEIYKLHEENNLLKTSKFSYQYFKKSDDKMIFFTGFNCSRFIWLFNKAKSSIKILHKLSLEDHMLVVLMKLKLGLLNKGLAAGFDIPL